MNLSDMEKAAELRWPVCQCGHPVQTHKLSIKSLKRRNPNGTGAYPCSLICDCKDYRAKDVRPSAF